VTAQEENKTKNPRVVESQNRESNPGTVKEQQGPKRKTGGLSEAGKEKGLKKREIFGRDEKRKFEGITTPR